MEDEGGEPFVGRSGQLLFALVREELSLERGDCYVTSVVKCRPPNNRTPLRGELLACQPWWQEQRAYLRARVIVTLGNTATRAVLGLSSPIAAVRGQRFALDAATVVPTYHPAAALRGGALVVAKMREDLSVVAEILSASAQ
jgi:uracil-DNA glycosylase